MQLYPQSLNIGSINLLHEMVNSEVIAAFRQLTELAIGEESKPDWRDFAVTALTTVTDSCINAVGNSANAYTSAVKEFARDEAGAGLTAGVYHQQFNAVAAAAVATGNVAANVTYDQLTKMFRPADIDSSKKKAAVNATYNR